jgi:hypothetical protein
MDIKKEIETFCRLNKIDDVESFREECLRQGFNIIKYGISPQDNFKKENNIDTIVKDDVREEKRDKSEHVNDTSNNENVEKPKKKKIKIIKN